MRALPFEIGFVSSNHRSFADRRGLERRMIISDMLRALVARQHQPHRIVHDYAPAERPGFFEA
jgi:hypothetical protein